MTLFYDQAFGATDYSALQAIELLLGLCCGNWVNPRPLEDFDDARHSGASNLCWLGSPADFGVVPYMKSFMFGVVIAFECIKFDRNLTLTT
jgi:hypothetical protein